MVLDIWTVPSLSAVDLERKEGCAACRLKGKQPEKEGTVVARVIRTYAAPSSISVEVLLPDVNQMLNWLSAIWRNQKPNGQLRELSTGNTAMCADATQSLGLALQQDFERQCVRAVAPAAGDPV